MRYIIEKDSGGKPCDSAIGARVIIIESRGFDENEYNNKIRHLPMNNKFQKKKWKNYGKDHGISKTGGIYRTIFDENCYYVEINSIDDINDILQDVYKIEISNLDVQFRKSGYVGKIRVVSRARMKHLRNSH